ncbi:hypothetical protein [Actinomycetospora straminea]|uniref:Uncharacterized protein n=1 Tax=Actinomycetospora straminea TaxID=663607 RepID=A0ABP9F6X9_9PSEU|nr:hypothetical protein [Actinomycetospora straminea]MDD7936547.1 hypothetical protein [Actinomycetospora straminea]
MSMAVVMSEMPDVWRKVLAEHVPDERHHCRECFHAGGRASWPCQTYRIAQEAKWVAEGGLPGTGPHGPGPSRTRMTPPEPARDASRDALSSGPIARPSPPPQDGPWTGSTSLPATGDWAAPFPASGGWAAPTSAPSALDDRPLAGDPRGETAGAAVTGERPYGSTFDAPYGASFGVDDQVHAARW